MSLRCNYLNLRVNFTRDYNRKHWLLVHVKFPSKIYCEELLREEQGGGDSWIIVMQSTAGASASRTHAKKRKKSISVI